MSLLKPRSLFGRNVLLILALIILAELTGALLFRQLVQKPRAEQLANIAIRNMTFLRTVLSSVPEAQRAAFVTDFNTEAGIEIATAPPRQFIRRPLLDAATIAFANRVAQQLHQPADALRWQSERGGSLWLPLQVDNDHYWIGVHNLSIDGARWLLWTGMSLPISALALFGAYRIQRHINQPLVHLVDAARSVAGGEMPPALPEDGPTEIATVSKSFNQMTQSLTAAERERAFMLAGISHDLRTPLTKLRLGVEIMRERVDADLAASMERSIGEMDTLIDQFIDFARAPRESEKSGGVDLNQLIRDCAQAYAERGFALQLDLAQLPLLSLHRHGVERALVNLLENAINYGAPTFLIKTRLQDQFVDLSVIDSGPGMSAAEIASMKRPFVRGSAARSGKSGAGLGLAIVERVAQSHGGKLVLQARDDGGLEATLQFPIAI